MNFVQRIRNWLNREKEEPVETKKKPFVIPLPKKMNPDKVDPERKIRECGICKGEILPDEVMTKSQGYYMHKTCIEYAKRYFGL